MAETNSADLIAHKKTYEGFLKLAKWAVVAMAILVVFLYVAIRP